MTVFDRKLLKQEFPEIIKLIQDNHTMGPEIEKELFIDNKPVIGLCHTRGYFLILDNQFFIQYTMAHIIKDVNLRLLGRAVDEVIFYDNFQEYESARIKAMSAVKPSEQTGLNFN